MRLFAETQGRGDDLFLIHGWSMNTAIWGGFSERLGRHARITCIDLPGHGFSPYDSKWDSVDRWAEVCLQAAPEKAAWVGWSLGALIGLKAALLAPQRVQALVVVAGTPRFVQSDDWPHAVPRGTLGQFAGNLRSDYRRTLERFLALQVRGSSEAQSILRNLRKRLAGRPVPRADALEMGLTLLRDTDLRDELAELQCPSLWLLGERDALVPVSVVPDLESRVLNADIRVFGDAAHMPFLSHTEETAHAIRDFLI